MKTTLNINDHLLAEAKAAAAFERSTLTRLVEEGLAMRLRGTVAVAGASRGELPVFMGSGGLAAGIDPTSNRALFDVIGG